MDLVLYHHGIKGMKWGVRRYQRKDGSLTPAGKKRQAKQEYRNAKDSAFKKYEKSISSIEKNYKRGQMLSKKDQDREAAVEKQYSKAAAKAKSDYKKAKSAAKAEQREINRERLTKIAEKGARKTAKILANVGAAYVSDQVFNNGLGTKIVKETVKQTGRAAVTAYVMARGGYNIRWYDN